jgi:pyridoxamine 5'-phosphate oxidase
MTYWRSLADIRREYGDLQLSEASLEANPFDQFKHWFEETAKTEKSDPTAMVLSTVDEQGHPDSRVVLLKGIEEEKFIFYTNYDSTKGKQLAGTPIAALNFYWPQMARQVRIRGRIQKISEEQSNTYFASRPLESQISAIASDQSSVLKNRQILEERYQALLSEHLDHLEHPEHQQKIVQRPKNWGGYSVDPYEIEFWQGRDNRLHDRFQYVKSDKGEKGEKGKMGEKGWSIRRLAP